MSLVLQVNAFVLLLLGLFMGVVGLAYRSTAGAFGTSALLTLTLGAMLAIVSLGPIRAAGVRQAFLMTTTAWLTAATAGSLPLLFWGMPAADAFFEAMSGITTTGSTVMTGLDGTDRGILLWRAILQWLGGVGIVVTGIAILPFLKIGGMQLFRTESSDKLDNDLGGAARFASATIWVYLTLSGICFFGYLAFGMTGFDALAHALTTVSTAGFSTHDASMGFFGTGVHWWATLFMVAGSLPFVWYIRVVRNRRPQSEQVRAYMLGLAAVILVLTVFRALSSGAAPLEALRHVSFNVVSIVTTTGFATTDYTLWGPFAVVVFFILSSVGGCTGSTTGGIKIMRWVVSGKYVIASVRALIFPHVVTAPRYEGRIVDRPVVDAIAAFIGIFATTTAALAVCLGFVGLDLQTALSGALTAVANVGPGIGPTIGPAGNFSTLPDSAKWLLSAGMLVGRLEIMTAAVLLLPSFWRW